MSGYICGELACWPTKDRMAAILRDSGLSLYVGKFSIRVNDCSHFAFQGYGGDLGDPDIDADADSVEEMIREGKKVSDALVRAGIKHRFEINDDGDELCGYLHHDWPLSQSAEPSEVN